MKTVTVNSVLIATVGGATGFKVYLRMKDVRVAHPPLMPGAELSIRALGYTPFDDEHMRLKSVPICVIRSVGIVEHMNTPCYTSVSEVRRWTRTEPWRQLVILLDDPLILADWLDERGKTKAAELLRRP